MYSIIVRMFGGGGTKSCEEVWPKDILKNNINQNKTLLKNYPVTEQYIYKVPVNVINPGCSLEGLMLKLKLQYFGHLMRRADSLEKTLMLGKIEGRRRKG